MAGLNLDPYKPEVDGEGDATQIAGGFTALETWADGNIDLIALAQNGASPGQVVTWDGTKWVPAAVSTSGALGGAELTYKEFAAPVNAAATTEATANPVVTTDAYVFDGAPILLTFFAAAFYHTVTTTNSFFVLWDNTANVSLGVIGSVRSAGTGSTNEGTVGTFIRKLTPAAGSRIYSVRAFTQAPTFTVVADAGGVGKRVPGFLRITKV